MRNARAFLAGGSNAQSAPAAQVAPAAPPAPVQSEPAAPHAQTSKGPVTADAIRAEWPAITRTLAQHDPEAGRAAEAVTVIGLQGDELFVGFENKPHLDVFKVSCAGKIREGLNTVFGINVKYVPVVGEDQVLAASLNFAGPSKEPASATPSTPEATPEATPASAAQPPAAAPASAEAPSSEIASAEPPYDEPPYDEPPYEEPPYEAPSAQQQPPEPQLPAVQDRTLRAPEVTRYGESVVREVLGATFIGEQPLP